MKRHNRSSRTIGRLFVDRNQCSNRIERRRLIGRYSSSRGSDTRRRNQSATSLSLSTSHSNDDVLSGGNIVCALPRDTSSQVLITSLSLSPAIEVTLCSAIRTPRIDRQRHEKNNKNSLDARARPPLRQLQMKRRRTGCATRHTRPLSSTNEVRPKVPRY